MNCVTKYKSFAAAAAAAETALKKFKLTPPGGSSPAEKMSLIHPNRLQMKRIFNEYNEEIFYLSDYIDDDYFVDNLRKRVLCEELELTDDLVILFVLSSYSIVSPRGTIQQLFQFIQQKRHDLTEQVLHDFRWSIKSLDCYECFKGFFQWRGTTVGGGNEHKEDKEDRMNKKLETLEFRKRIYSIFSDNDNLEMFKVVCNRLFKENFYYGSPYYTQRVEKF